MIGVVRKSLIVILAIATTGFGQNHSQAEDPFVLVVMDPLSKPLSCDCVRGYAQREYKLLAEHLESSLGRQVEIVWFESLAEALDETRGKADLVVGKHSVVLADERTTGHELRPLAQLTGKLGDVTQKGLIVVRQADSAQALSDLDGYQILFGPQEAEEKSSAPEKALKAAGVAIPSPRQRFGACSEAATALLELPAETKAAAVISSYAEPLLEGCGSIKKGDLRVIGESNPVPFVTAFVSEEIEPSVQERVLLSLMTVGTRPDCLIGLETLAGFVPWNETTAVKKKGRDEPLSHSNESASANRWTQFRGVNRDGRVAWLPSQLPDLKADLLWKSRLPSDGVGGLVVVPTKSGDVVVASGRDAADKSDRFVGLNLKNGKQVWTHQYAAPISLDYGNSPRGTPTFADGVIVTLGATGIVSALDAESGAELWRLDLAKRFKVPVPTWGFSGSPLVIEDRVLVQVAKDPSLISLDLFSGEIQWQVSGDAAAYSSLISLDEDRLAGVSAIGYFLRRVSDGELLWSHAPKYDGDFGVPTPLLTEHGIVFTSENNGVQHFSFKENTLSSKASSSNDYFLPDSHSPVRVGNTLLVAHNGLHALDLHNSLETRSSVTEDDITAYASIIASNDRVLVTTEQGECILASLTSDHELQILDRLTLSSERIRLLSHPAIYQTRLLIRVGDEVRCYKLPR